MRNRGGSDRRGEQGFTFIELLTVVVIIGILAAIAIPSFITLRERGWQAQLVSDVRNAILDVEAEAVNNDGAFPDAIPSASFRTSDTAIQLTYRVNDANDVFCVEGTDSRLGASVARWSNGSGVELAACPVLN